MTNNKDETIAAAIAVLRQNDRGHYTVPTHGLYPFQWNWDSCLSALGQSHYDEDRAWTEIETLFEHQWEDGMVPHIVFHEPDDGYFPGPDVWQTHRPVPTSGITQPAVAGFAIRRLYDRSPDKSKIATRATTLLSKVNRWHEWFYRCRDPKETGLVAIIHPWEAGRDNSVDWDVAFEEVPTEGVMPFTRRDTTHANPEHRPTQAQYERYIWLIQHFRNLGWDNTQLHDASPFQIVDPGFNGILLRSCSDIADLAAELGEQSISKSSAAIVEKGLDAMESLWSDEFNQYLCMDRRRSELIQSPSIAGLLAIFAYIRQDRGKCIAARISDLGTRATYLVPSHDPAAPEFDGSRYWRGPVWLIVNYMIADGLQRIKEHTTADAIVRSSLELIAHNGLAEYYDPHTGAGCGGAQFTWTAAMVLEFLQMQTPKTE
ncbi:MAG: hypothetical protein GKR96_01865 [Gammaproteobacteria bacterium]|nr:hypothetical protein [Gammaproteobacteria bacterium]